MSDLTPTTKPYAIASYCNSVAWGGLEMNVLRFLRWMRARGWPVFFYGNPATVMYQRAVDMPIERRPLYAQSKYASVWMGGSFARQLEADGVRVLLVHQSKDMLQGVMAGRRARHDLKLVYRQHMHIGADKRDMVHAWMYRHFDAWMTSVSWLADRVLEKTVVPKERIHVVHPGIELEQFTAGVPDKAEARRMLDLPPDVPMAGVIGRLDPKKCQDVAIRALKRVHSAGHPLHLLVVGDQTLSENSGYGEMLRRLVADSELGAFVHFRPHQSNPSVAYNALDMFLMTSQSETYGMVTVEAICSGLPVIGTRDGGTIDLIDEGKTGLFFTPMNDEELSDKIMFFLSHPERMKAMAEEGRHRGLSAFSHTRMCEGYEAVFAALTA